MGINIIRVASFRALVFFISTILLLANVFKVTCNNQRRISKINNNNDIPKEYKIVCYYDNRLFEVLTTDKLYPQKIDPSLCTHLIYSFAKVEKTKVSLNINYAFGEETPEISKTIIEDTVSLKRINKNLKVLLSIGGWHFSSTEFQLIIADDATRKTFIDSILTVMAKYGFDGLDIYSENPYNRGDLIYHESKAYLIPLCKELRQAFEPFNYLLSAALPGNINIIPGSYEVMAELAESLDFISIMAYDLHGTWENVTIHHAPLYTLPSENRKLISVENVVKDWLRTGIPREKLLLGVSSYGRSFAVTDQNDKCPWTNTPIMSPAPGGIFTFAGGFLAYFEICIKTIRYGWKYKWLENEKVPFAFALNKLVLTWVGFDDVRSIDYKMEYLINAGFGGAMMFSLDNDDYNNDCRGQSFPLLRVINYHLNKRIKVDFPDPNILFNVTKAAIEADHLQRHLRTTLRPFDHSKNYSFETEKFCDCKKGLQNLTLENGTSGLSYARFDCDKLILLWLNYTIDEGQLQENFQSVQSFSSMLKKTPADDRVFSFARNSCTKRVLNFVLFISSYLLLVSLSRGIFYFSLTIF